MKNAKQKHEDLTNDQPSTALVVKMQEDIDAAVDPTALVMPATQEQIERMLADADYVAPRFVKIQTGSMLVGIYVGRGSMELADQQTGELKPIKTHQFKVPGKNVIAWTIGAYELDRGLEGVPFDGSMLVSIYRGPDKRTPKGRIVSQYQVTARRYEGGAK